MINTKVRGEHSYGYDGQVVLEASRVFQDAKKKHEWCALLPKHAGNI